MKHIFLLCAILSGCSTLNPEHPSSVVRTGLKGVGYPRGSVIQYCHVPAKARWLPNDMNNMTTVTFQQEGYLVLIDEQPKYDFAHSFKLVFIPGALPHSPEVKFHGNAFPSFGLVDKDGNNIHNWKKM